MTEKKRSWFRAGEFARLCGVSKHTLFHYDAVGVVRPARVEENGYRWYSIDQFYAMDIVATLQAAGMSLHEIKDYMSSRAPERFVALLEEKQHSLAQEQAKLARMQRVLRSTAARTREGLCARCGVPRLETCDEQALVVTPVRGADERAQMEACVDHFAYCMAHGIGQEMPIGAMLRREHLDAGAGAQVDYFFNPMARRKTCDRLFLRPAGCYAVLDARVSYERMDEAYRLLLDFIAREGCEVCGNSYEQDLVSYMATPQPDDYIIRLSLQVTPPRA